MKKSVPILLVILLVLIAVVAILAIHFGQKAELPAGMVLIESSEYQALLNAQRQNDTLSQHIQSLYQQKNSLEAELYQEKLKNSQELKKVKKELYARLDNLEEKASHLENKLVKIKKKDILLAESIKLIDKKGNLAFLPIELTVEKILLNSTLAEINYSLETLETNFLQCLIDHEGRDIEEYEGTLLELFQQQKYRQVYLWDERTRQYFEQKFKIEFFRAITPQDFITEQLNVVKRAESDFTIRRAAGHLKYIQKIFPLDFQDWQPAFIETKLSSHTKTSLLEYINSNYCQVSQPKGVLFVQSNQEKDKKQQLREFLVLHKNKIPPK